ncbi:MAG TPA: GNAT family N-acetyltransferase [Thermoanaerobaculia bacterium]|nr:GNAT family N-acetyltransferase [Thermoanaerobaculia bacterium]
MIRTATRQDLPRIAQLLANANDAPYDLARVAEEKCFGAGVAGEPRVRIFGDFNGVAVQCGRALRLLAVDRAHRNEGIGSALLDDTNPTVIAAEAGNYFTPGVVTTDENTISFFEKRGYRETARTQNLIARELPEEIPEGVKRVVLSRADGEGSPGKRGEILRSAQDDTAVLHFIEREFGRIWRFEVANAQTVFYVEQNGEIAGFAAHGGNNRGLGFFGPTGVAKQHRGKGLGRKVLIATLADMRRQGYEQAIIPWTDAIEFYERSCGAEVQHRFVTLARYIPQP